MDGMLLSFVVPAHNEERFLGAALESIHAAAREIGLPYEIVVANDHSTDGTVAVAERGGARVVTVNHRKISATRNSGARASTGDRLIFVDADTQVDAAVVRAALAAMALGAVGGGAGVRFSEGAPRWATAMMRSTVWFMRVMGLAAGCFVFCTRQAFEAAGGFDEAYFGAEEWLISNALKRHGRFVVLREAVVTSPRKFESRTFAQTLGLMIRLTLRGRRGLRDRRNMGFWYEDKR
jgi:glycosyltransferase involved in cell wall biosynthesis